VAATGLDGKSATVAVPLGVCFVRRRDHADRVALEVDPRRADLERL
jgi:hypothetical protein